MTHANYYADMYNAYDAEPKKIRVLDSTLREGEQHPGVSFTNKERIQVAWMLVEDPVGKFTLICFPLAVFRVFLAFFSLGKLFRLLISPMYCRFLYEYIYVM